MRECDIRSAPMKRIMVGLCRVPLLHSADIMNTSCESRFSKYETSLSPLRRWHSLRRGRNHNMSHAMKGGGAERGKGERGGSQGGAIRPLSSNPRFLSN